MEWFRDECIRLEEEVRRAREENRGLKIRMEMVQGEKRWLERMCKQSKIESIKIRDTFEAVRESNGQKGRSDRSQI